jgi:hypothetical protein
MSTTRRLVSFSIGAAAAMLISGTAFGALDGAEQKCIDGYNNKLRLVSAQAGKSAVACVKGAAKGDVPTPDTCIVTNTDGKIGGKRAKVTDLYTSGKCTNAMPIQQGSNGDVGNDAHENAIIDFAHDIYGDPVTTGIVNVGKVSAKCLQKATQRPTQAFTALVLAHRACKKAGLKAGTITDSASLTAVCGTLGTIDPGGKAAAKFTKSAGDISAACGTGTEQPLSQLFPGLDAGCYASGNALGACINAAAGCRACKAINAADGANMDCDLIDNGAADSSCVLELGTQTCDLDGANSSIALQTLAFPIPPFSATGTISLAFGAIALDGTAAVDCNVVSLDPVIIPGIGDVCVNPYTGCSSGRIDCDGGAPQNVDLVADHTIGACVSNAACSTACDGVCAGMGANYEQLLSGCEGKCQGGSNDEAACTNDTGCPGGQCVGGEPVAHAGQCNCTCGGTNLGGASPAGSISCPIGTQIDVELPSDNDCLDPNTIVLPPLCGGITTTTSTGQILNANNGGSSVPAAPQSATGTGSSCGNVAGGTLTGLKLVGQLGFYDSTLSDILALNTFTCQ